MPKESVNPSLCLDFYITFDFYSTSLNGGDHCIALYCRYVANRTLSYRFVGLLYCTVIMIALLALTTVQYWSFAASRVETIDVPLSSKVQTTLETYGLERTWQLTKTFLSPTKAKISRHVTTGTTANNQRNLYYLTPRNLPI